MLWLLMARKMYIEKLWIETFMIDCNFLFSFIHEVIFNSVYSGEN